MVNRVIKKQLGEVLGISGATAGRKVRGEISWSLAELFSVAELLDISVHDLIPHQAKVPEKHESPLRRGG
ncbi:Hypothetical protein CpCap5W_0582 [Corynebacterium pseudotuberculosis]|uniref:helix-turn-helix domain-containing protein n=1 Tax=Corynebacterium pseudotuberculosis TaxID=1719 RepID=UPI0001DD4B60|nr:helix-turn-helix domain-containing protein [Corynebacterium pseudotuberculosis]ADL20447.1 hypothetical protein CP1002_02785 [Corynebacterium pseudotuberculosis 1002]AJC13288.1 Transcription regulator BetR, N-terminal [Corynebacterium pseudotuberculosis]AKJ55225.1 Transcription regulator BetR, N-terminal [Corynebacterium pseudotuberculosis]ALM77165.1 Transcription regulator BetR, N-terminal [Corynebacterium pseudotuberculosis]ANQ76739.1 Transcription regulator BetR, N-terminal [Corynebacteri